MSLARVAALAGVAVALFVLGFWFGDQAHDENTASVPVRRCIDWTVEAPTRSEIHGGCGEPGDVLVAFAIAECTDGRELFMGDIGWGYVGEPMKSGGERVPEDTRAQCDGFADAARE